VTVIQPYKPEHEPAVGAFNERLSRGGSAYTFPALSRSRWLPREEGRRTFIEGFVALDAAIVRGGYLIKHQPFALCGQLRDDVFNMQLPLSESIVDPAYGSVSVQMLSTAVRRHPRVFSLGMGGIRTPLPKVLEAMGWTPTLVPFFFRVVNARSFLKEIRLLRTTPRRRFALDFAAATGLGALAFRSSHAVLRRPSFRRTEIEVVARFEAWADAIWERACPSYSLVALRDASELNLLYPATDHRPIRLRVTENGRDLGWAVVFDTQMTNHKQFGAMRLGSIVDCLAVPGEEQAIVRAATHHLRRLQVELIVSNQSHRAWRHALRRSGYLRGPSNYGFVASPGLIRALDPWSMQRESIHMTRGDGDGPIHV
jgi:hypothetical protein